MEAWSSYPNRREGEESGGDKEVGGGEGMYKNSLVDSTMQVLRLLVNVS